MASPLTIHGIPRLSNEARYVNPFHRERIVELMALSSMKNARDIVVINPYVTSVSRWRAGVIGSIRLRIPWATSFFEDLPASAEAGE